MLGFVRRLVDLYYSVSLYFGVWDSWPQESSHMFSKLFHHKWFGNFVNSRIGAWSIKLQEKQKKYVFESMSSNKEIVHNWNCFKCR